MQLRQTFNFKKTGNRLLINFRWVPDRRSPLQCLLLMVYLHIRLPKMLSKGNPLDRGAAVLSKKTARNVGSLRQEGLLPSSPTFPKDDAAFYGMVVRGDQALAARLAEAWSFFSTASCLFGWKLLKATAFALCSCHRT
eukprot:RCo045110